MERKWQTTLKKILHFILTPIGLTLVGLMQVPSLETYFSEIGTNLPNIFILSYFVLTFYLHVITVIVPEAELTKNKKQANEDFQSTAEEIVATYSGYDLNLNIMLPKRFYLGMEGWRPVLKRQIFKTTKQIPEGNVNKKLLFQQHQGCCGKALANKDKEVHDLQNLQSLGHNIGTYFAMDQQQLDLTQNIKIVISRAIKKNNKVIAILNLHSEEEISRDLLNDPKTKAQILREMSHLGKYYSLSY